MLYNKKQIIKFLKLALKEDIGSGDITTNTLISTSRKVKAKIIAKDNFILCGIDIIKEIFLLLDKNIKFNKKFNDGDFVRKNSTIAEISGNARAILSCERTALNILQHLSAIATKTRRFVDIAKKYNVQILDTRKTIPGLRLLQKYAVKVGGGKNHRLGLYDEILIKDNHIALARSASSALKKCKEKHPDKKVEIEVKTLKQINEILPYKPDIIMLDNMKISEIKKARRIIQDKAKIEVSGGVNLKNIEKIAKCGVDYISIGELTHTISAPDVSLEIEE